MAGPSSLLALAIINIVYSFKCGYPDTTMPADYFYIQTFTISYCNTA
jgi:hypothetical protein